MFNLTDLRYYWHDDTNGFNALEDFAWRQLQKVDLAPEDGDSPCNHYTIINHDQYHNLLNCVTMYAVRQDDKGDVLFTSEMQELIYIATLAPDLRWKALANSTAFFNAVGKLEYVTDTELKVWVGEN